MDGKAFSRMTLKKYRATTTNKTIKRNLWICFIFSYSEVFIDELDTSLYYLQHYV